MSATHYSEDDLTLYYYGEGAPAGRDRAASRELPRRARAVYRDISGTLAMIAAPEAPERGDQYGLEVWQRIRHQLPERPEPWWAGFFRRDRLVFAAAAAMLVLVAFVARARVAAAAGQRPRDRRHCRPPRRRRAAAPPETPGSASS